MHKVIAVLLELRVQTAVESPLEDVHPKQTEEEKEERSHNEQIAKLGDGLKQCVYHQFKIWITANETEGTKSSKDTSGLQQDKFPASPPKRIGPMKSRSEKQTITKSRMFQAFRK
jgi:hypothetical protein